jgi:hypothetical protein
MAMPPAGDRHRRRRRAAAAAAGPGGGPPRKIDLVVVPMTEAIGVLPQTTRDTNAILHLTC